MDSPLSVEAEGSQMTAAGAAGRHHLPAAERNWVAGMAGQRILFVDFAALRKGTVAGTDVVVDQAYQRTQWLVASTSIAVEQTD